MLLSTGKIINLTILLALVFGQIPDTLANVTNEKINNKQSETELLEAGTINFKPPENNGEPDATTAGASRSSCPNANLGNEEAGATLAAIVPKTTEQWLTIKEHPSFFIYVPATSAGAIFFQLKNNQGEVVYQNLSQIKGEQAKIIEIKIPENKPPLEVNENYQWSVFLLCNYQDDGNKYNVEALAESYDLINEPWVIGTVKRVQAPSSLSSQPDTNISLNLASEYAENGLWFDTLVILSQLIQENPNEPKFQQAW